MDRNTLKERTGTEWLHVDGKITSIRYAIPDGRSSLEVYQNYQSALNAGGFKTIFDCIDDACLTGNVKDTYVLGLQIDSANPVSTAYFDHARYLLAKQDGGNGAVFVCILVGEDKQTVTAFVQVVEEKPIESNKVAVVKADKMFEYPLFRPLSGLRSLRADTT